MCSQGVSLELHEKIGECQQDLPKDTNAQEVVENESAWEEKKKLSDLTVRLFPEKHLDEFIDSMC